MKGNYPNLREFPMFSIIKKFCKKKKALSSRISQNNVNEMIIVAVEDV